MEIDINTTIKNFIQFLDNELPKNNFEEDGLYDWLQKEWEERVEKKLPTGVYIIHIGEGADIHGTSCRFSTPDACPTHEVVCSASESIIKDISTGMVIDISEYQLDNFINWNGKVYDVCGPINCVLLSDEEGQVVVVALDDISFKLIALGRE